MHGYELGHIFFFVDSGCANAHTKPAEKFVNFSGIRHMTFCLLAIALSAELRYWLDNQQSNVSYFLLFMCLFTHIAYNQVDMSVYVMIYYWSRQQDWHIKLLVYVLGLLYAAISPCYSI